MWAEEWAENMVSRVFHTSRDVEHLRTWASTESESEALIMEIISWSYKTQEENLGFGWLLTRDGGWGMRAIYKTIGMVALEKGNYLALP